MSLGSFYDPLAVTPGLDYLGVTDEYLADLSPGEFAMLAPKDQDGAAGNDGSFAAGFPAILLSAAPFAAQGVLPGDLCVIHEPARDSARVRGIYVVTAVGIGSLTLRSRGPRSGFGSPPGSVLGEVGLKFRVPTARPQIAISSSKFARRYRVASTANIVDPTDFRPVVAYDALTELYTLAARMAGDGARDGLYAKAKQFASLRDEEIKVLDATYHREPSNMPLVSGRLRVHQPPWWGFPGYDNGYSPNTGYGPGTSQFPHGEYL